MATLRSAWQLQLIAKLLKGFEWLIIVASKTGPFRNLLIASTLHDPFIILFEQQGIRTRVE